MGTEEGLEAPDAEDLERMEPSLEVDHSD